MEFTMDDLNGIIKDLVNEPAVQSQTHLASSSAPFTVIKQEPPDANEKEQAFTTTTTTDNMTDRQYCLIVFNNPRWSQHLQKRSPPVAQQQSLNHEHVHTAPPPTSDAALDTRFVAQLRKLINEYMAHTKRPFPVKYWLDLTHE